jgi:hypothetical protein
MLATARFETRNRRVEWIGDLERAFAAFLYPNRFLAAVAAILSVAALAVLARRRHWDAAARRHPRRSVAGAALLAGIALPLGWYLASPLFLSTSIDEPLPVAAAPASSASPPARATPAASASPARTAAPTPVPTPSLISRSGAFTGADDFHFGRGTATLIETSPGSFVLRLENFEVRNGPDLYVYLSPSADGYADGTTELARLKADRGNQNYDVPAGADLTRIASVVIWCKAFSVQFAVAPLS